MPCDLYQNRLISINTRASDLFALNLAAIISVPEQAACLGSWAKELTHGYNNNRTVFQEAYGRLCNCIIETRLT